MNDQRSNYCFSGGSVAISPPGSPPDQRFSANPDARGSEQSALSALNRDVRELRSRLNAFHQARPSALANEPTATPADNSGEISVASIYEARRLSAAQTADVADDPFSGAFADAIYEGRNHG